MTKRKFAEDTVMELIDDAPVISRRPWRHGHYATFLVAADGEHYLLELPVHVEEGMQFYGDVEGTLAHEVTKTVTTWEPKP